MNFEELSASILVCNDCEKKFGFKPIPIVHGTVRSKILQFSQAPSKNVHITKKPFNDSTGKKLKYEWYMVTDEIFYNHDNFYITALAHCFPGKTASGGDKAPPRHCADKWLSKEMDLVDNELYVVIGAKAASYLFPGANYNDLIFKNSTIKGKPAIVLPHPSPLNIRWYKEHPDFEKKRLLEIRHKIWDVLGIN